MNVTNCRTCKYMEPQLSVRCYNCAKIDFGLYAPDMKSKYVAILNGDRTDEYYDALVKITITTEFGTWDILPEDIMNIIVEKND